MAEVILIAALAVAALALILGVWRLIKAPGPFTRAIAVDLLTQVTMPLLVGVAVQSGRSVYVDVALVYAILSFLGVLALARYFEKGL